MRQLVRRLPRLELVRDCLRLDVKTFPLGFCYVVILHERLLGSGFARESIHLHTKVSSFATVQRMDSHLNVNTLRLLMDSQGTLAITTPEGKRRSLSGTSRRSFVGSSKRETDSHEHLSSIRRVIVQPADYPGGCDLVRSQALRKSTDALVSVPWTR